MRLLDQDPIDPEIAATLDAIDATLAGEPVDAQYAELAEIALLLASDRPQVPPDFARSMDARVVRRFAGAPPVAKPRPWWRPPAEFWQASGAVVAGVALIAAIVVVASLGKGGSSAASSSDLAGASSTYSSASSAPGTATSAAGSAAAAAPSPSASNGAAHTRAPNLSTTAQSSSAASSASSSAGPAILQPPTTGRKVVQSAQLALTAAPTRIDDVAQEIYDVVGQVNGIVNSSSVTQGGPSGYANFQLSIPSASLAQAMSRLSQLTYAQVASRTDGTQDITGQFDAATRALADARALRTSLLKQLANATTTAQVNSLTAQIHDADASISSDEATVARLNHQANFSQVDVQINASTPPVAVSHGGGFGIGRATHDAGRVLTVVAGGALIVIAALTPLGLVVALIWWVGAAVRRRRREQALDSV